MTRSNFFKSLLGILIAPKAIVEISKSIEPEQKCYFDAERINKRIAVLKSEDIKNKKRPAGYAINYDTLRNHKWVESYKKSKDIKYLERLAKAYPQDCYKINHGNA